MGRVEAVYKDIELDFQRFPAVLAEEFGRAWRAVDQLLSPPDLIVWARRGQSITKNSASSLESPCEYFRASPAVLRLISSPDLDAWAHAGEQLNQDSPTMAAAYFRASPETINSLRPGTIATWAGFGHRLYKGTWKSSSLASKFFEISPVLVRFLSDGGLAQFVDFIETISHRSFDLSLECLTLGKEIIPQIAENQGAFMSLINAMAEGSWREVKGCFTATAKSLPYIDTGQRTRFLEMTKRLAENGHPSVSSFLLEGSQALGQLETSNHAHILALGESLLRLYPEALPEFLRNSPAVLSRITESQLDVWFDEGIRILRENKDGGLAFFRMESARCEEILDALSSSVDLSKIKDVLRMYCRALTGTNLEISSSGELAQKGIGWVSREAPTTEGSTVFLPTTVDRYANKADNFAWYKVVGTHQAGHLEYRSFAFEFDRPSYLFPNLRTRLSKLTQQAQAPSGQLHSKSEEKRDLQPPTDMQRFFDLLPDRKLSSDIFTVIEDSRLDAMIKREYAGIRRHYLHVQHDSLGERPLIKGLPAQEALVEFLVRLSLQKHRDLPVPTRYAEQARRIAHIALRVLRPKATVEDSAEATLRIYAIISEVPNEDVDETQWENIDVDQSSQSEEGAEDTENIVEKIQGLQDEREPNVDEDRDLPSNEHTYESPQQVDYRGAFKPELVQILAKLKATQPQNEDQPSQDITKEMLEDMLSRSAEVELEATQGDISSSVGMFTGNVMREAGMSLPLPAQAYGQGPLAHTDEEGGPLESSEPGTHIYAEWDFRANDYKPRWCMVHEKAMPEGELEFWHKSLQSYTALQARVRREFERMVPESFRKIRPLADGEDFDFDTVIQAFVDIRTGVVPSEKLYWRRNKVHRDVGVVFLLDMSASTAETIEEPKGSLDEWDTPDEPVDYMAWLRSRRGEGVRRSYKRIIDLERESTILLIQAMETLGDQYGIYGFSGYGRENVEFYTIKDLNEALTDGVRRRVDKIAPLHATRMGPAIRHATHKLGQVEARTRVLFLISDGRPQDRGYSREGVEKEYAVHDTKMALTEARHKGITPYCLTVDKSGHDYLKTMCQDMGYEVLADIHALPERLPFLYRRLTI